MKKEIDNIFVDVRNAFRLLARFQERVLNIVNYIREQTPYTDMWGSKNWFSDEIRNRRNSPDKDYAKLNVYKDMSGLDFSPRRRIKSAPIRMATRLQQASPDRKKQLI